MCVEEVTDDFVNEKLKKKLRSVGIITCEFYFLHTPQRSSMVEFPAKEVLEKFGTVDEKCVKGEALSHQAM